MCRSTNLRNVLFGFNLKSILKQPSRQTRYRWFFWNFFFGAALDFSCGPFVCCIDSVFNFEEKPLHIVCFERRKDPICTLLVTW